MRVTRNQILIKNSNVAFQRKKGLHSKVSFSANSSDNEDKSVTKPKSGILAKASDKLSVLRNTLKLV